MKLILDVWTNISKIDDPRELHNKLESIKSLYNEFFLGKDEVIDKLRIQLKEKNDEYLRSLTEQGAIVDELRHTLEQLNFS